MESNDIFLATTASSLSNGKVKLLLPGETASSGKYYKVLNTSGISNGTRVACVKMSGTYVVLGAFGASGGGGGGSGTVTSVGITNGGGLSVSGSPVTSSGNITVGHSNSVTAKSTQAVYPIKFDSYGHITGSGSAVTIPTKVSDLTNDSGFVNAAGAASAAPVQSVNGQTGAVTVDELPSVTSADNGKVLTVSSGAWSAETPSGGGAVSSVNGQTGAVFLSGYHEVNPGDLTWNYDPTYNLWIAYETTYDLNLIGSSAFRLIPFVSLPEGAYHDIVDAYPDSTGMATEVSSFDASTGEIYLAHAIWTANYSTNPASVLDAGSRWFLVYYVV